MAVTTFTTFCLVEFLDNNEVTLLMAGYHHLGDALTVVDDEILLRQVDKHHANLSTIVCIDGSWCVQHGQPMLQGQTTTWTYLRFIALWQGDVQTCRYQATLHRMQGNGRIKIGAQIHSGTLWRSVCRQLLVPAVDDFNFDHFETFRIK